MKWRTEKRRFKRRFVAYLVDLGLRERGCREAAGRAWRQVRKPEIEAKQPDGGGKRRSP